MAPPASARALVLAALLMQNVGYTLLRRYSQGVLHEQYSFSELLLLAELVKLVVAACVTAGDDAPSDAPSGQPLRKIAWLAANSGKMLVLAAIYGGMNLLSFVAIRRITAAAFTVCAQLKILTTAACSVVFLQRKLSLTKWRALVTLALGATLVSLGTLSLPCDARRRLAVAADADADAGTGAAVLGLGAVILEVTLSGFASAYFEGVIKRSPQNLSIWDRNFQLALHSLWLYVIMIAIERGRAGGDAGGGGGAAAAAPAALEGFSFVALLLVLLGAGGGLLVALTMKYADAILKTLATSGAIVLSTVLEHALFDAPLDLPMSIGAAVVILAIFDYTFDMTPTTPPTTGERVKSEESRERLLPLAAADATEGDSPRGKIAISAKAKVSPKGRARQGEALLQKGTVPGLASAIARASTLTTSRPRRSPRRYAPRSQGLRRTTTARAAGRARDGPCDGRVRL